MRRGGAPLRREGIRGVGEEGKIVGNRGTGATGVFALGDLLYLYLKILFTSGLLVLLCGAGSGPALFSVTDS